MSEDEYAKEKLTWVKHRLKILDEIDKKLNAMKAMAEYAQNHELQENEKDKLNKAINKLQLEVQVSYETDKNFLAQMAVIELLNGSSRIALNHYAIAHKLMRLPYHY